MSEDKVAASIREHQKVVEECLLPQSEALTEFSGRVVEAFHQGGRLLVLGGGQYGAIASVVANLFLHRLSMDRPSLPAVALGQDAILATALAREGQIAQYFASQVRALASEGDVLLAFGDASRDESLEEGLAAGRQIGCTTAAFLQGKGNIAGPPPEFLFLVDTLSPPRAQEGAILFGHLLCELVESEIFGI